MVWSNNKTPFGIKTVYIYLHKQQFFSDKCRVNDNNIQKNLRSTMNFVEFDPFTPSAIDRQSVTYLYAFFSLVFTSEL